MPNVSIIICAYNAERYIEETLGSVRAQTYQDYELIVVNDGSTDNTRAILACCKDAKTRILDIGYNGGKPLAQNTGISAASGRHILHLDADDLLTPTTLVDHLRTLEDADVSYAGFERFTDDPGKPFEVFQRQLPETETIATLVVAGSDAPDAWWAPPGAVMARREFAKSIIWNHHLQIAGSELHYYACMKHAGARFASTGTIGLKYRVHAGSLSHSHPMTLCAETLWLIEHWTAKIGPSPKLLNRKRSILGFMRSFANIEFEMLEVAQAAGSVLI